MLLHVLLQTRHAGEGARLPHARRHRRLADRRRPLHAQQDISMAKVDKVGFNVERSSTHPCCIGSNCCSVYVPLAHHYPARPLSGLPCSCKEVPCQQQTLPTTAVCTHAAHAQIYGARGRACRARLAFPVSHEADKVRCMPTRTCFSLSEGARSTSACSALATECCCN